MSQLATQNSFSNVSLAILLSGGGIDMIFIVADL